MSVVGLLAATIVLAGCTHTPTTNTAIDTESAAMAEEKMDEKEADRPVKEFTMTSFTEVIDGEFFPQFSMKDIAVSKGDLVRIKLTVTSGTHNFKIDEFNVYSETPLNEEIIIEFVADKAGEFVYYCNKPRHRELGQWGTLTVLE